MVGNPETILTPDNLKSGRSSGTLVMMSPYFPQITSEQPVSPKCGMSGSAILSSTDNWLAFSGSALDPPKIRRYHR